MSNALYDIITDKIVNMLDKGEIPWRKPWAVTGGAVSHTTGRRYSLLNQILLLDEGEGMDDIATCGREFLTFNQIKAEGGSIRKGERSKMVVFWKIYRHEAKGLDGEPIRNEQGEPLMETTPVLRYFNVWEVSQCEGIERKYEQKRDDSLKPAEEAERIVKEYFAREACTLEIEESDRAYYNPVQDIVHVPRLSQYEEVSEYYSTLFHEMTHSTGHPSRCNRKVTGIAAFGSESYSKEELVAEMGAAFLSNTAGVDTEKAFRNSAAYIQGWSRKLREDKRLFVNAAAKAEAAVNYILGTNDNNN